MKNLVLLGFIGSGKTSVGHRVAGRMGRKFVDTDVLLRQREGREVSEIFAKEGEAYLRRVESELVAELAGRTDGCVIATGGGVIQTPANLEVLRRNGVLVALWVDAETAHQRIQRHRHRPLLDTGDRRLRLTELQAQREPLYQQIENIVDTRGRSIEEIVGDVIRIYRETEACN